ncbi:hypothetical protein THAOC_08197, partial [Thalassiosira oceanica]
MQDLFSASPLGDVFMPKSELDFSQFWPFPLSSAFANYDIVLGGRGRGPARREWAGVTTYRQSAQVSAEQWGAVVDDEVATGVHGVFPLPM